MSSGSVNSVKERLNMTTTEFFDIFDYSYPHMEKTEAAVKSKDFERAKRELLNYFIKRKALKLSFSEPVTDSDKNFPLAYIARHSILPGPNESDSYLSSIFVTKSTDNATLDVTPFLDQKLSVMIMSRKKEKEAAFLFSPRSIFPPYIALTSKDGDEEKIYPEKFAFVSTKEPDFPLADEDIYEICEESDFEAEAYGVGTGRAYLMFDLSNVDLKAVAAAKLVAKITLSDSAMTKELLVFNISDHSWDNTLTWSKIKGNVFSWESSPSGPFWDDVDGSDKEYLNVICRFNFARPMAAQYLSDVEKNSIYGEKLLFLMDAFSKKKPAGFNRVLETGERLSNFTAVLGALVDSPAMTPDLLVSILTVIYRDIKHLYENPDLGWSNWAVVRTSGLSKAIDFLPELKEHDKFRASTRKTMEMLFDRMYSPDFSFRESGLSYSFWCIELLVSAFKAAQLNNDPYSAFMRGRLEKAINASLDLIYPNFYDTNIGDSNYADKRGYLSKIAQMLPTPKLMAFVGRGNAPKNLSACYPYANTAALRSSYDPEKAMYLLIQATPFDGHAHQDISSLVFYAYGRPLIADMGRYGYSESDISSHLKTPAAHNSIEIEDATPTTHSEARSKIDVFSSNSAFDFVKITSNPYYDIDALHKRSVFFNKNDGFVIVSDFVSCSEAAHKFNQNWHFMPHSGANVDFDNVVCTRFDEGADIKLICPASDVAAIEEDIFSEGYGMAEKTKKAVFTKYGQCVSFTTLLYPTNGGSLPRIAATDLTPNDISFAATLFNFDERAGVFATSNTAPCSPAAFFFDGEAAYVFGSSIYLAAGKKLVINKTVCIESEKTINDIYLRISGGIVEIESSSLRPTTHREEAIKIYAPKTTHVLFNSDPIPFTLYSDYVYAVGTIQ